LNNELCLAEMLYYILYDLGNGKKPLGLGIASLYGPPHQGIYESSYKTYITFQHFHKIQVIDIKNIDSVVMIAPDPRYPLFFHDGTEVDRWYLMQKPGKRRLSLWAESEEPMTDE
jgi:hypothetical protein